MGKGLLRASPENGKVGGIDADADTVWRRLSGEKPVDGRRLAVAHGCNDRRQCAVGDRPQALLQPPGNIDRVKIMPDARHPLTSGNIVSAGIIAYVAFWRNWLHDAAGKHALISEK